MNISRTVVNHPKGTLILFLSIIIFGLASMPFLNKDLFPKIDYPVITVITTLENKSPQEIRNLITVPMEEILSSTAGLKQMRSVSRYGESVITLTFDWGVKLDVTYMETREKLDFAKSVLPQGTTRPIALRFDPNSEPLMTVGLEMKNRNKTGNERAFIRKNIKPLFERVDGIAFVDIIGGDENEVQVLISLDKLYANNLGIDEVIRAIEDNNIQYPVGSVEENKTEYTITINGKIRNEQQLASIIAGRNEQGVPIYLANIATIRTAPKDKKLIFRLNGKESVALNIYKEGDANIVKTAAQLQTEMKKISEKTKNDIGYSIIYDNSRYINFSINDIVSSAIIGIILTLLILYLFLEDSVSSMIVAMAIPITILMTLFFMYVMNISLNLISLTGLSIGIGSMVDSNIVIIDNIKRYLIRKGDKETLIRAANEVTAPVISAILTNIAVFLPIVFVQGIAGSIFKELSLVVTFSHLATLVTSIMLTPALYQLFQTKTEKTEEKKKGAFALRFENFKVVYLKLLDKVIDKAPVMISILLILTFLSVFAFIFNRKEILPNLSQNSINIICQFPPNNSLEKNAEWVNGLENMIRSDRDVDYHYSIIGNHDALSSVSKSKKVNLAQIRVILRKGVNTSSKLREFKTRLEPYFRNNNISLEETQTAFSKLFPNASEVYILGTPLEYLDKVSGTITNILMQNGVSNLYLSLEKEETVQLLFDRAGLNQSGLSTKNVAEAVFNSINGKNASKMETPDEQDLDILVKLDQDVLQSRENLSKILLKTPGQDNIQLSAFVDVTNETHITEIHRMNQKEMIFVRFMGNMSLSTTEIQKKLSRLEMTKNATLEYSWDTPEVKKSINSLMIVLMLSIVVIFVIIAFQFESLGKSLLIMLTIPLIFIGLSPVLMLLGISINVISLVGIILLVGIVVDNAIVMVDFYERTRLKATSKLELRSLIIEGSGIRFRPIIMTSVTTLIALLPLILYPGEGMEFQKILSITIASGFLFSTSITLFFLPAIYYSIEKRRF